MNIQPTAIRTKILLIAMLFPVIATAQFKGGEGSGTFTHETPEITISNNVNVTFQRENGKTDTYRPSDGDGIVPSSLSDSYNNGSGTFFKQSNGNAVDFSYDSLTVRYDVILSTEAPDSISSVRIVFMYDKNKLELNDDITEQSVQGVEAGTFFTAETDGNDSQGPIYLTRMLPDSTTGSITYAMAEVTASTISGNSSLFDGTTTSPNTTPLLSLHFRLKKAGKSEVSVDITDYNMSTTTRDGDLERTLSMGAVTPGKIEFYPGDTSSPQQSGVPDSKVDFSDLTGFASSYFTTSTDPEYRLKYDIGSTSTSNYYDLPVHDGEIGFRDLVAFAAGYTLSLGRNETTSTSTSSEQDMEREKEREDESTLHLWTGSAKPASNGLVEIPVYMQGSVQQISVLKLFMGGFDEKSRELTRGARAAGIFSGEHGLMAYRWAEVPGSASDSDVVSNTQTTSGKSVPNTSSASSAPDGVKTGDGTDTAQQFEIHAAQLVQKRKAISESTDVAMVLLIDGDADPEIISEVFIQHAQILDRDGQELPFVLAPGEVQDTENNPITSEELPERFDLYQNYPNPFNPVTSILYALPEQAEVSLHIYNISGQRVATLVKQHQAAGTYEVSFDASGLSSGVYLYRLTAGSFTQTRRMMLVK